MIMKSSDPPFNKTWKKFTFIFSDNIKTKITHWVNKTYLKSLYSWNPFKADTIGEKKKLSALDGFHCITKRLYSVAYLQDVLSIIVSGKIIIIKKKKNKNKKEKEKNHYYWIPLEICLCFHRDPYLAENSKGQPNKEQNEDLETIFESHFLNQISTLHFEFLQNKTGQSWNPDESREQIFEDLWVTLGYWHHLKWWR